MCKFYNKRFNNDTMKYYVNIIKKTFNKIDVKDIYINEDITHYRFIFSNNKKIRITEIYFNNNFDITTIDIFNEEKQEYETEYYKGVLIIKK